MLFSGTFVIRGRSYYLHGDDFRYLHDNGVSQSIVDYMASTAPNNWWSRALILIMAPTDRGPGPGPFIPIGIGIGIGGGGYHHWR